MTKTLNEPSVAMFMSIDLSGSTAFKSETQTDGNSPAWLEAFEEFFREVPLIMMGQIAIAFMHEEDVPDCSVWKVIGDEIVFLAHPRSARQTQLLTIAFYNTIINYDSKIFERWPLRVRGCCWAAQISRRNRQIAIPEMMGSDKSETYIDYLGPDVDAGFRLAGCVGRGQLIISSNLVQLLAGMAENEGIQLHYAGSKVLKGVYKGRPYPLFLMSIENNMPKTWEWEAEPDAGLEVLRKNEPMPYPEVLKLVNQIQGYLNRMCHAVIEPLTFDANK
jgi:hypothetical protein